MKLGVIVLMVLTLTSCAKQENFVTISNGEKLIKVNVELARAQDEITKGLMYRTSLPENRGMLFVFEGEEQRFFWMKNTLIPLDMIFISGGGRIVNIEKAVPCKTDNCPLYLSYFPAKYVLEVNGNFTEENNIEVGDFADIKI